MKIEILPVLGVVAGGWWGRLSPTWKGILALFAAVSMGAVIGQTWEQQRNLPTAVQHLTQRAESDSIRIERLEDSSAVMREEVDILKRQREEDRRFLENMSGKVDRTLCWVSRNRDPICLLN